MIDNNERMTYLDIRHQNNTRKRIINAMIENFIEVRKSNQKGANALNEHYKQSIKNLLFIKFCGIEYEGIFQSYFNDRKG